MTTAITRTAPQTVPMHRVPASEAYRADIDGLRALAVLLVVTYHVWLGRVSGGVDVFLMISALFMTTSFVRRLEASGKPGLARYWGRTFARLLPLAGVTLVGVGAMTAALLPPSTWPSIWEQTWASLFYYQNWALASDAVDYYAPRSDLTTPLLHFWSLSIQGQVFVIWPLLMAAAWAASRLAGWRVRPVLTVMFAAVFAASFARSITETATNQAFAYFDTWARLWEFAAGSLLALALPRLRVGPIVGSALTWIGLAGLISCGLVLDVASGFPGYLALWPILSAAAVILGGNQAAERSLPRRILLSRPLQWVGGMAYGLYLVHWPILIGYFAVTGSERVDLVAGLALIAGSLVLAWILTWAIETPVRRGATSLARQVVAIAVCVAVVAVPLASWSILATAKDAQAAAAEPESHPGARSLLPAAAPVNPDAALMPGPTVLGREWVSLGELCAGALAPDDALLAGACGQSRWSGERTVVVVGDSHSEQFMGALMPIAEERGWRVVSLLKGACALGKEGKCAPWNDAVRDYVLDLEPDAVFTVATASEPDGPGERVVRGIDDAIAEFTGAGIDVIAVRDNPRFEANPYTCLLQNEDDPTACRTPRSDALAQRNPAERLDGPRVHLVDLSDAICPDGWCPAEVGNVAVYLDDNHLTWAYARTLAPFLEEQLVGSGYVSD